MPTMPNGLVPNVSAYSHDDPGGVMRTEVDGGASRFGLDWDRGTQRYSVTMVLDLVKYSVWTAFYFHVIKKGAISFDMRLDTGFGTDAHSVNIMPGSYSGQRTAGNLMVVTFVVEAETQAYDMTAADASAYIDLYNGGALAEDDLFARIAQFANVDTLVLDF